MKILQICPFFYPVKGGVEKHVLNLSKELLKEGHQVEILTSNSDKFNQLKNAPEDYQNLRVKRFKVLFSLSKFLKFWPGVFFELLKKDYDVAHVHVYRHPHTILALITSKLRGKKCILTTHAPMHSGVRPKKLDFLVKVFDFVFAKLFLPLYDGIICIIDEEKPFFQKFSKKIFVIPNGITEKDFENGVSNKFRGKNKLSKHDFVLLFVGRLHKTKGLDVLYDVAGKLEDCKFILIGPNDSYAAKNTKNVSVLGELSDKDLKDAFAASNAFMLPSYYEPFGIVLLEAMAHKLPLLATNKGGPNYFVKKEFGLLLNPFVTEEWIKAIKFLKSNLSLCKKMGKKAESEARKFLWSSLVKKVLEVYNK